MTRGSVAKIGRTVRNLVGRTPVRLALEVIIGAATTFVVADQFVEPQDFSSGYEVTDAIVNYGRGLQGTYRNAATVAGAVLVPLVDLSIRRIKKLRK